MIDPRNDGRTRIKICGITSIEMAQVAIEAGADAIGLVHAESSPRFLRPQQADSIARMLPPNVPTVSVYCNHALEDVLAWSAGLVQLHGDEDEAYLSRLRREAEGWRIIRGFAFHRDEVQRWNDCADVDMLLIEGDAAGRGKSFAHDELAELMPRITKPVILAGGLTPKNVGAAIRAVLPFAVDVSSGVESSRGVKDAALIREFCEAVHQADQMRDQ